MTEHRPGDGEKAVNRGGRPVALTQQHILLLREIVTGMPHATLDELAGEISHLGGVQVCTATIRRTLCAQGIVRSMPARQARGEPVQLQAPAAVAKRYGYTAEHRREPSQYSYVNWRVRRAPPALGRLRVNLHPAWIEAFRGRPCILKLCSIERHSSMQLRSGASGTAQSIS